MSGALPPRARPRNAPGESEIRPRMRRLATVVLLVVGATGCAAPSFVAHTGRTTPKGSVRLTAGSGYQVNTSAAAVVRHGRDLAEGLRAKEVDCPGTSEGRCWNAEDVRPIADAGFLFALVAPLSVNTQVAGRYGFANGFDAGLRWGPGTKGLDVGWAAFGPRDAASDGWAGSLLAGWGTRDLGTLGDAIEKVIRGKAGLTDYSLTFVAGRQWSEIAHLYAGGRYILTRWELRVLPDLPIFFPESGEVQKSLRGTDASGSVHHVGAVLGGALGYKRVFLGAEVNLLQTFGHAEVLFEEKSFSGFGVMPAVYVYGQY
jgi:hypothetical protein